MIGALVGKGNTADVFEMDNNKVIKLFKTGYPLNSVRKEFENSKLLNMVDVPIAKSHRLVTCSGRYGIIYDRVDGESMLDMILNTQDFEKYATTLALLHKKILSHKLQSAISLKSILKENIEDTDKLSMQCKSKLITTLEALPDGDNFCHGDFHFGNVIISQEKYFIIDYMNVCRGHEYGDIARTVYLIEMTPVPAEIRDVEHILYIKKQATDIYLKEMGISRECLSDWLMIVTAARLSELSNEQTDEKNAILKYFSICGLSV
jgi:Ser/Thr protein kinase RdoA (MazF antagonist)